MPRITVFGQIAIVVSAAFLGLHFGLISCTQPLWGDVIIGSLGTLTVIGYSLIKAPRNGLTRQLIRIAFVWSGLVFLAGLAFGAQFLLGHMGFLIGDGTVWLSTVIVGSAGYYHARNPRVRHTRVEGSYEEPLRLLHLTDLHVGDIWNREDLARIVRKSRHYRPDCVVITGDLLDGMEPVNPDLVSPLERFDVPVYFVSGNHDSYTEREELLDALRDIGVIPLEGKIYTNDRISILGIGYNMPSSKIGHLSRAFRAERRPRIVLKHKPDQLPTLLSTRADAILCGHVHFGQIWPLGYLGRIEFPRIEGTCWFGRTMLHISQGSATWGPPFRLGTRSEFTIVDFVPK